MKWKNLYEHNINLDVEVADLIEKLDDALSDVQEEFEINFAERQFNDFVGHNGVTESATEAFNSIQSEILRRALVVIRTRWERSGN